MIADDNDDVVHKVREIDLALPSLPDVLVELRVLLK
jgi:hypothetical protein